MKRKYLSLLLLFSALFLVSSIQAQEPKTVVLAVHEWAHISIGEVPTGSFRFELIASDVQVYFHIYNDSASILDFFIVHSNETFSDPLHYYSVTWRGNLTQDEKAMFTFESDKGPLELVVSSYTAVSAIPIGRPSMSVLKTVATPIEGIYDVFLDEQHFCSFKWHYATFENQTLPQLLIYDNTGTQRDQALITVALQPLLEYGGADGVGWMIDSFLEEMDMVKWILYSGREITLRPNTGFGVRELPHFATNPDKRFVHPNDPITVHFILPEGVTNFTTSLSTSAYLECLTDDPEYIYNPNNEEHTLSFKFNPGAKGQRFTITVRCEKTGIVYESSHVYSVRPFWYETQLPPLIGGIMMLIIIVVSIWQVWKRRRPKPTPSQALTESEPL